MGLRLQYKATGGGVVAAAVEPGVLEADEATGVVEALVSVTGVVDEDGDLIEPGAYTATLKKRTPKGIFHHDWKRWVAKTLDIAELQPGDPRLPKTTRTGEPWPKNAGGLWVKCQFNLETTEGKEAFSNIQFFEDAEWSIGYKVKAGHARKTPQGVRVIKAVDLYEYSPVLFGAAPLSGTLSVKELTGEPDDPDEDQDDVEGEGEDDNEGDEPPPSALRLDLGQDLEVPDDEDGLHTVAEAAADADETPPADLDLGSLQDDADAGDEPDTPQGLSLLDLFDAPDDTASTAPSEPLEDKAGTPGVSDTPSDEAAVQRLKSWYVRGEGAAKIRWGQSGDFMRCVRIAGKHMTPDKAKGFCANRHKEALGVWPGREGGKDKKDAYDPALEIGPNAGHLYPDDPDGLQTKMLQLPGTLEDLRDKLRQAVEDLYVPKRQRRPDYRAGEEDYHWVCIEGTWLDRVVVTHEHSGERDSYSIPYTVSPAGDVTLGAPQPVTITVTPVITPADMDMSMAAKADMLTDVATALRAELDAMETKAGRVFSAVNERRFRQIMELLLDAFKSAGLDLSRRDDAETESSSPQAQSDLDTTSPTVHGMPGKVLLSGDLLKRRQALKAFTHGRAAP